MAFVEKHYDVEVRESSGVVESSSAIHILYSAMNNCRLKVEDKRIPFPQGEVFLLNVQQMAHVEIPPKGMVAIISLDYRWLCQTTGRERLKFGLENQDPTGRWYKELKRQVEEFLLVSTEGGTGQIFHELESFFALARLLVQQYLVEESQPPKEDRASRLLLLLSANGDLSLQELADQLYLSSAAASRLFQKVTGEGFSHYKKRIRLERAKRELAAGNKPITAVAMEAGFTSSTAFNRDFKEVFGLTPSQYRNQAQIHQQKDCEELSLQRINQVLQERSAQKRTSAIQRVEITPQQMVPLKSIQGKILTVGPAYLLQGAVMQNQVSFLARHLDVEYLRIWSPFSQQMLQGEGVDNIFHFTNLDTVLDFCVDNHLKVLFDLAQRRDFSLASESQPIYARASQKPMDWFQVLDAFLQHIRRRYTEEVVSQWVYGISFYLNDLPYSSNQDMTNEEVWRRGYSLIKSLLPKARVAGPGLLAGNPENSLRVLDEVLHWESPPDIFTSTHYPYFFEGSLEKESIFQKKLQKVNDSSFLAGQLKFLRTQLDQRGFQGELWVTDWGISLGNRNFIQDSCYRGAVIVDDLIQAEGLADRMSIFCASDLLSAYGDSGNVLSGSAGILSQTGIRKPAYYAFRFLQDHGKYKLCQTEHCLVTAESPQDLRVLCFNRKQLGPKYYLLEENSHLPNSLEGLFADVKPVEMELHFRDLPSRPGPYYIRQRILNKDQGAPLTKWIGLGCIPNLTREDLEYLERTSVPEVTLERQLAENNELTLRFTLEANEIRMIYIT